MSHARRRRRRAIGIAALCGLALASVPLAAPGPGLLPAAKNGAPGWLLGPFGQGLGISPGVYYALLWLAFASYLLVLRAAAEIPRRLLWGAIAVLVALFVLAPPLLSQDVFSYVSYARLGVRHHLNPYVHVPADLRSDPAFPYVGWTHRVSDYGPVFTLVTYPFGLLPVPAALWSLKALAGMAVIALAGVCARLAPARGEDPRFPAALVALNPLVLVHVVGGAHNDALMMLAAMLGCAGVLARREAAGGAALSLAAAAKASAALLAPFALLGAARRRRLLAGGLASLALIGAISAEAFGGEFLDSLWIAGGNESHASHHSVPSGLASLTGAGIGPMRNAMLAAFLLGLAGLLLWTWRGADWLRAAGWAMLGLLVASAWLLPWYVLWVLPLAALSRDRALTAGALALCGFQLINRIPI